MAIPDSVIVILAAGKGTRLKSALAKVLHRAGGRSLVEHYSTPGARAGNRRGLDIRQSEVIKVRLRRWA